MQTRTPWLMILALYAAGLGAAAQFSKMAVVFPLMAPVWPEAGASLGLLVSLISALGVVFGLVAGIFVARLGTRRMLIAALVLGSAMSGLQALTPGLGVMLVSRVIEGAAHLAIVVAAPTLIAQITPDATRPAAMTFWGTFFGVAFAVTALWGVPFAGWAGVGALFALHGVFMLALAVLLAVMLPEDAQFGDAQFGDARLKTAAKLSLHAVLRQHVQVYASPFLSAAALGWLFYTMTFVALLTLAPALLPGPDAVLFATLAPLAGITLSLSLGVRLLRYLTGVQVVLAGFATSALCVLTLLGWPAQVWLWIALFGALGLVQGASFAAIAQINQSAQDRALANGALAQMGNLGNLSGTPVGLLLLSGLGLRGLLIAVGLAYVVAFALHLGLARRRQTQS